MTDKHVVAFVGGHPNMLPTLEEHLAEWGIEVCSHSENLPVRIPVQATLVLLIKTACSHKMQTAAQLITTKRNIPLVVIDHQWRQAETVLRRNGILDVPAQPDIAKGSESWTEARLATFDRELARLGRDLRQAEDLLLEQHGVVGALQRKVDENQGLVHGLQGLVASQKTHIEGLQDLLAQKPRYDAAWEALPLQILRKYASKELGITGASKIRGGKAALLEKVHLRLVHSA